MRATFITRVVVILCSVIILALLSILLTSSLDLFGPVDEDDVISITVSTIRSTTELTTFPKMNSSTSITALTIMEVISNNTMILSSKCGDWQKRYESFHKSMISGSKIRVLVAVPTMNGNSFVFD